MLAAVIRGAHQIGLAEVPKPVSKNDTDVILKVTATTICTSDVHFAKGYFPPCPPFVIGHEFTGVVEESGSAVKKFKPGDRVAVPPVAYCGFCDNCRKGRKCTNSSLLGTGESFGNLAGGLAEFVRIPYADSCMVKIPDEMSDENAIFVGDNLSTGYCAVDNCNLKPGDTVAIFGAGPVGLCAVQAARLFNPSKIILVGHRSNRLQTGLKMGATHIIDEAAEDPVARIMEITNGQGVDAACEAVGLSETVSTAAQVMTEGAILSIVGFFAPGNIGVPMQTLFMKNATIKVRRNDLTNMRRIMGLVATGELDPSPLVTHRMPFREFEAAYAIFSEKQDNVLKVILRP